MDVKKVAALSRQIDLMEKNKYLSEDARARGVAILKKELAEVAGQLPLQNGDSAAVQAAPVSPKQAPKG